MCGFVVYFDYNTLNILRWWTRIIYLLALTCCFFRIESYPIIQRISWYRIYTKKKNLRHHSYICVCVSCRYINATHAPRWSMPKSLLCSLKLHSHFPHLLTLSAKPRAKAFFLVFACKPAYRVGTKYGILTRRVVV